MKKRILIIKSKDNRIIINSWFLELSESKAQKKLEDFCKAHNFDSEKFTYEIK